MIPNSTQLMFRRRRLGAMGMAGALVCLAGTVMLQADMNAETSTSPHQSSIIFESAPRSPAPPGTNGAAAPAPPSTIIITHDKDTDDDDSDSGSSGHGHSRLVIHDSDDHDGTIVPIMGILGVFGTPVLIVFCVCYFKYRRRQENLATVREYLNKGLPVPPQLLNESLGSEDYPPAANAPTRCQSDIRRGLKWSFIGFGVTLALLIHDHHSTAWAWGLIPLVLGLGYLFMGWLDSPRRGPGSDSPSAPPTPGNLL